MSNPGGATPGISLSNTAHSEVAPCLPLPSLPVFCGAIDQGLRLLDDSSGLRSLNRKDVLSQADKIAKLLQATDVSYLDLRENTSPPYGFVGSTDLHDEVLRCNSVAFEYATPGPVREQVFSSALRDKKTTEQDFPVVHKPHNDFREPQNHQQSNTNHEIVTSSSKKSKLKKKKHEYNSLSSGPDAAELQDAAIRKFSEVLEDLCGRAVILSDDRDETEWLALPAADIRILVNETMAIRAKKIIHLVSVDTLVKMLKVLDHQIHRAEGLSINDCERSDSDAVASIYGALDSIHASLAIMADKDMPKQIYKEEVIERILEFCRRQIMDIMAACDPAYRALHKPVENVFVEDDEDEEFDADFGSASSRKRRNSRSVKVKKSAANRGISSAVNTILQKLCTILGFLKDLLSIERLSDSCILQLVKTGYTTFLVENIQLLQLKAMSLISGIYYTYTQHRTYVMDEALQVLLKLPFTKKLSRTYHLPDEEQRQIQLITALLIQLVHCSANLPDSLREASNDFFGEVPIDASYPNKCHESATDACCQFWSRVLQRLTSTKSQDTSELKTILENLVMDLLTTLNLPEYPASAPMLEVLCCLLLQNAGLKSKDITARSMAIDLLGTIAARLKQDAVLCRNEKFWIVKELLSDEDDDIGYTNDVCSICMNARIEKSMVLCEGCRRLFHIDCMGVRENEVSSSSTYCQLCLCRKQLLALRSYCKSIYKDGSKKKGSRTEESSEISKLEILQQMLLNYLQDAVSADDVHLVTRWFFVCLWYKDDPSREEKISYYLARLKSKAILRESQNISCLLTRNSAKKIALALGQRNSFARGFDKILHMLLASLRENSPVIRAKALKAVSIIVEADPEVLRDKLVQTAVEGRFCDSAISVREAALELVGRHIASHPDVGLQYFEKVAERMKDTGVSVRKRAIKIIKDMCTSNANFSEFISACIEIISRVSDDESSIQDLVCKTFYEFWFEEPSGSHHYGNGSSVPLDVAKKTEQIVEMLRRMPNHQLLVTVIKRNLALDFFPQSAKAAGINPISLTSVRKRCELMCTCLLERILQVEEMNNEEAELNTLPYVLLLHAFCVVDPALCAPASDPSQFLVTLQPYLKTQADSRAVAKLLESIVFIIDSIVPLVQKLSPAVVEELEQDLKQMIVRHSFLTVVHSCIKCLCSVSKLAGKGAAVVEYLIQVFFNRLVSLVFDNTQQVGRSLFCLGLLIRYGYFLLSASSISNKYLDIASSLSLFKKYLQADDFTIKVRSLQALGYLLIARPDYMLEKDVGKILEATLASTTDPRLKMQTLQNVYEYLLDAESKMGTGKNVDEDLKYNVDGVRSVPDAAGAGDTNICGGIVQLYWDSILGRCLDASELVRQSAIKIVEVVLRQGLVHPITCVPYLIALETDPQELNSKLAHHLLMNMNEKYPAFFESRLGDGLQMSFTFIQTMSQNYTENSKAKVQQKSPGNTKGKSENVSFSFARLGVSRIYKLIRTNRMSRNKFMSSVVRKFDTPTWSNSVIPFLMYCTEILALLPFTVPEEPLYLIYSINRVVQVRAGTLEANMKAFLNSLQENNQKPVSGNGINLEELFPQSNLYDPVSVEVDGMIKEELAGPHLVIQNPPVDLNLNLTDNYSSIFEDNLHQVQGDCTAATALQLLLKLKRHLKIVYNLNDARCQAFLPNDTSKSAEALQRQTIPFNISDTRINLPTNHQDFLLRYQELKNALREDTVDYSTYTANIKRKRPPAKRGPKTGVRTMTGGNDDDDEDDDDESYRGGGSAKKINSSGGRKVYNSRSRQRL